MSALRSQGVATSSPTAAEVVDALEAERSDVELAKNRRRLAPDEPAIGVRMRTLFRIAKGHQAMGLDEVERLLDHPAYEPRMAAFCILDFQARWKVEPVHRRALCDTYLRRHDAITTWDMVDRAAPRVVGGHLATVGDLEPLHDLAASDDPLRRRTAVTAPLGFLDDDGLRTEAFTIAARLAADPDPVVHNAVGIFLKHAGGRDQAALLTFLDQHGPSMPRPGLRLAIEKLDDADRRRVLAR